MNKMKKIYSFELWFFMFFGLFHVHRIWGLWIYLFGGAYVLFDLFAIAIGLEFWHKLLLAMFDVTAPYWNLLWGGFIVMGGVSLLKNKRLHIRLYGLIKPESVNFTDSGIRKY